MTIEIQKPELEALIREQLQTGTFEGIEDLLTHALTVTANEPTGADSVAATQADPVQDADPKPEHFRGLGWLKGKAELPEGFGTPEWKKAGTDAVLRDMGLA